MAEPKIRFKQDDGTDYPEWIYGTIGDLIELYLDTVDSACELPVLTSSKNNGIEYQDAHFGRKQLHDITGYNILPRNYCTYRNRSDGTDFTFNINTLCDKGIVSKFYPVFKEKDCNLYFLMTLLNNEPNTIKKIAYTAKGTGQKVLSILDLQKITIKIPQIAEQEKIADFLTTLDELIKTSEEEVSNLEKQKKSVMQKIFSQEIRFKQEDGSDFPEWEEKTLGECCFINPKTDALDDEFVYIDLGCVDQGCLSSRNVIKREGAPSRAQRVLSEDDVLFQSVRPYNMGHYHFHGDNIQVVASTGFTQLRFKEGINSFLYQFLFTPDFNSEVNDNCTGSNYPAINSSALSGIYMPIPHPEEQKLITEFLTSFDDAIVLAKEELAKWKELKKGLLQQMFV